MMKAKLLPLLFVALFINSNLRAQETLTNANVSQADARIHVEMKYSESVSLGFQWVMITIHNNTADKLKVRLEYTAHGVNGDENTKYIGSSAEYGLVIEPGKTKGGDINNCVMQYYGKCKDKAIKTRSGLSCINNLSYEIIEIENLTEKENKEKEEAVAKSKLENEKKEAAAKEAEAKQAAEKEAAAKNQITNQSNNKNTPTNNSSTSDQNSATTKSQNNTPNTTSTVQNSEQEAAAQLQQKQNEYDAWKKQMQDQNNKVDAVKASTTLAIFTILGGFVYRHMGRVEPGKEYHAPKKGEKPYKAFVNAAFGFSTTTTPLLYESKITTMVNGVSTTKNLVTGDEAFYLNFGGDFQAGVTSDHFSLYGGTGVKFGIEPTLHGSQTVFTATTGGEYGIAPIKAYGRYTINLSDNKKLKPTNVEDKGQADYSSKSNELEYGVKFTTKGTPSNNYRRTHFYFGLITKTINFGGINSGTTAFYFDPTLKKGYETGKKQINGINIEIRQDHNFKFFIRAFPKHLYAGNLPYGGYAGTSVAPVITATVDKGTSGFYEFGFLRCIDKF